MRAQKLVIAATGPREADGRIRVFQKGPQDAIDVDGVQPVRDLVYDGTDCVRRSR